MIARTASDSISRMPRPMRDAVSRALADGATWRRVARVCADGGFPGVTAQNVTNYRKGAHQEWLRREERLDAVRRGELGHDPEHLFRLLLEHRRQFGPAQVPHRPGQHLGRREQPGLRRRAPVLGVVAHHSIAGKDRYVEYGSGKTTCVARKACPSVVSVETDPRYAARYRSTHCDLGPTRDWGYPVNQPSPADLERYFLHARDYDVMLLDGRFRVGVAFAASPGWILVHDYQRPQYHVMESFMQKTDQVEGLALFHKERGPGIVLGQIFDPL